MKKRLYQNDTAMCGWTRYQIGVRIITRAGNNRFESIRQANQFDRANRIHVEFDSSVLFQPQKPRHNV